MRKILSLLLVIMLVSLPVTHTAAELTIQEACQQAYTKDDLKTYIKHHYYAGEREHTAIIVTDQVLMDPGEHCINKSHPHHKQFYKRIVLARIYQIHYKCVDSFGDKWRIDINGKMGQMPCGLFLWDDEQIWEEAITNPCNTYDFSHTYDLNTISDQELTQLFNLMISVDQYLSQAKGVDVIWDLALSFIGGATGIADALYTISKAGGKIPYIGEAILIGVGVAFAVSALFEFADADRIINILRDQTVKTAEAMHPPAWGVM